jgi:diguanylate cyclase (GGDEF)-like protein
LKRMNDTFGHEKGDAVILKAAEFIRRYLTEQASGFRIGGDEFVMLIRDCTEEKVQELVSTMRGDEKGNLSDVTAEFYCRLAIGGAFRKTAETLEETIKRADDEMYKNKHSVRKA